ncbi:HlyD family secretion protein [Sphingomonas sp. PsM26]|nr:HlyD family secretion protein [Sphingomonas sp. PsM26]
MSSRAKIILVLLALAAVLAGALWYVRHETSGKYLQETNDAQVMADMVTVSPRVAGYVAEVLVRDNQDVVAGQPLARIDPRNSQAQAAQAEAQIAVAEAQADAARAQIGEQYATIEQARAQLAAAQTKAAYDAGEVARYRPLAASGAETRQQLAQLTATARQSAQNARAQGAALAMQQRRVSSYRAQVQQGVAQGQAARAQLASANVDVTATLIRAASAGRIGDKSVTTGQYVQAGTRLMSIVPLDRLYITANFKETQLALMRPGQPVSIHVDALDGIEIKGRVESVAPGTGAQFSLLPPENATGNFTKITQRVPVRVSLEATPAARRLLVPGLSVTATVDTIGAKDELERIRDQQKHVNGKER